MAWWRRGQDARRGDTTAPGDPRRAQRAGGGVRESGDPPSANGASSMHLFWDLDGRFTAAEVTLEVLEPPTVDRLYFWALQATFTGGGRDHGGAHLGLQWHHAHPGSTAVNWGGYHHGGGELAGTASALPSATGNVNTRDLPWLAGVPYRLRIERGARPGAWRGSVRDLRGGTPIVVRELHGGGTHLRGLMVWSEVFARCDHPPVTVRWSDPVASSENDAEHAAASRPATMTVNYQRLQDGGCTNTVCVADGVGWCQRTATARTVPAGARLAVGDGTHGDRSPGSG